MHIDAIYRLLHKFYQVHCRCRTFEFFEFWHELEAEVPASEAWELFGTLALARFVEQQLPDMIEKVQVIHGDGGAGTIIHIKFASGVGHTEKFTKADNETRAKEAEVNEGGPGFWT
nr:uncharacterized protein LOC103439977 [Malus domestica]